VIRFLQPDWFWAFAPLAFVMLWRGRRGPVAAVEFSDISLAREVALRTHSRIGRIIGLLPIIAAACMIVGLARPQLIRSQVEVTARGIDIVLALDISGSMRALDFKVANTPVDRIAVVKSVVSKFIDERPNDRIGLIAFAGVPYMVSPLTLDHDWLRQNLERVDTGSSDDGTAIGSAIAAAVNHLRTRTTKSKVIILLTDGVNNTGLIPPLAAAEAARAFGVKVYTIGVGVRGKALIPLLDDAGRTRTVMAFADVDEATLRAIADKTGGQFYRATDTDSLQRIYEQINQYETSPQTVERVEHAQDLYKWALFASLGLLGLWVILRHTRFRRLP
jgi:Ca-activated chloride channel family protein